MRVVKELTREEVRISIFSWNNKYILKFELGPMEQTFKLNEMDVMEERELDSFLAGEFFEKVKDRFDEMAKTFRSQLENL
jgi:hypothetical protein